MLRPFDPMRNTVLLPSGVLGECSVGIRDTVDTVADVTNWVDTISINVPIRVRRISPVGTVNTVVAEAADTDDTRWADATHPTGIIRVRRSIPKIMNK